MQNELIIVSEYCRKCHIEPSFIDLLQEGGLIEVMTEGGERYLTFTQLPDIERTAVCIMTYPSTLKELMPSITCCSVWKRCRMNFMSYAVS